MIDSGHLDKLLTFQKRVEVSDGIGGITVSWSTAFETFGSLTPIKAEERLAAGRLEHTISHRVVVRYRADHTPQHRIKYVDKRNGATRYFRINSMVDTGESGWRLVMDVEEVFDV
jgi:SPP1 family predicted phage head-tail adaptor